MDTPDVSKDIDKSVSGVAATSPPQKKVCLEKRVKDTPPFSPVPYKSLLTSGFRIPKKVVKRCGECFNCTKPPCSTCTNCQITSNSKGNSTIKFFCSNRGDCLLSSPETEPLSPEKNVSSPVHVSRDSLSPMKSKSAPMDVSRLSPSPEKCVTVPLEVQSTSGPLNPKNVVEKEGEINKATLIVKSEVKKVATNINSSADTQSPSDNGSDTSSSLHKKTLVDHLNNPELDPRREDSTISESVPVIPEEEFCLSIAERRKLLTSRPVACRPILPKPTSISSPTSNSIGISNISDSSSKRKLAGVPRCGTCPGCLRSENCMDCANCIKAGTCFKKQCHIKRKENNKRARERKEALKLAGSQSESSDLDSSVGYDSPKRVGRVLKTDSPLVKAPEKKEESKKHQLKSSSATPCDTCGGCLIVICGKCPNCLETEKGKLGLRCFEKQCEKLKCSDVTTPIKSIVSTPTKSDVTTLNFKSNRCGVCAGCTSKDGCGKCKFCTSDDEIVQRLCKAKRCLNKTNAGTRSPIKDSQKARRTRCYECEGCKREECGDCWVCKKKVAGQKCNDICVKKKCENFGFKNKTPEKKTKKERCGVCKGCNSEACGNCQTCTKGYPQLCRARHCINPIIKERIPTPGSKEKTKKREKCGTCTGCISEACNTCPVCTKGYPQLCKARHCLNPIQKEPSHTPVRGHKIEKITKKEKCGECTGCSSEACCKCINCTEGNKEMCTEKHCDFSPLSVDNLTQVKNKPKESSPKKEKKKRIRCGECSGCVADACGECSICQKNPLLCRDRWCINPTYRNVVKRESKLDRTPAVKRTHSGYVKGMNPRRYKRCGDCEGCLAPDCGECKSCYHNEKYGAEMKLGKAACEGKPECKKPVCLYNANQKQYMKEQEDGTCPTKIIDGKLFDFRCYFCKKLPRVGSANRSELYRHYAIFHYPNEIKAEFGHMKTCPHCAMDLKGGFSYVSHMGQKHNEVDKYLPEAARIPISVQGKQANRVHKRSAMSFRKRKPFWDWPDIPEGFDPHGENRDIEDSDEETEEEKQAAKLIVDGFEIEDNVDSDEEIIMVSREDHPYTMADYSEHGASCTICKSTFSNVVQAVLHIHDVHNIKGGSSIVMLDTDRLLKGGYINLEYGETETIIKPWESKKEEKSDHSKTNDGSKKATARKSTTSPIKDLVSSKSHYDEQKAKVSEAIEAVKT